MKRIQSHPGTLILRHQEATQEIIRRLKPMGSSARLLCFGSSWGAEVLPYALALPETTIVAAEIERKALDSCAEIFESFENVHVIESDWASIKSFGPFDAINCNAVLCKYPAARDVDNINDTLPFAKFEEVAGSLVDELSNDGVISLYNSNYSILDSDVSNSFKPMYLPQSESYLLMDNFVSQFDKLGRKIIDIQYAGAAFSIGLTKYAERDSPEARRLIAKRINEGLFVKNPSSKSLEVIRKNEGVFDAPKPNFDGAAELDYTALYRTNKFHNKDYYVLPMTRYMSFDSTDPATGNAQFLLSLWWDGQILGMPSIKV